ncbi:MAG: hypothetical protein ACFFCT_01200 [Candidatus Odinarchaeota archaeon]
MQSSEERSGIEIPVGVKPDAIMTSLTIGHGYRWTVLTRRPLLIAHGAPSRGSGNMPELLITGDRSMIIAGSDVEYVDRIRQILAMLQRQSHRVSFLREV